MYAHVEKPKENKSKAIANSVAQKKNDTRPSFTFVDNRPDKYSMQMIHNDAVIQSKFNKRRKEEIEVSDVMQRVHIGREPEFPNNYRGATRREGSTSNHYGGGPFNIQAGIYSNNRGNPGGTGTTALPGVLSDPISDYSGQRLLTPAYAAANAPEVDHIVTRDDLGSNSYSNARVLSKNENNNPRVDNDRPDDEIVTVAHEALEIEYDDGINANYYVNHLSRRDVFSDDDDECIDIFGGLQAAINAPSGTTQNHTTLTEE